MMTSILKWLHKNEYLVHMSVMLLVFYGIPTAGLAFIYPSLVAPMTHSALMGVALIALLFVSYKAATRVTDMIKNAVAQAAIEQIRDATALVDKIEKDAVVDYTSPNMLVVDSLKSEKKAAEVVQPVPVEKKKRAPRTKPVKKEG